MKHTEEYKKKMSVAKKKWWQEIRKHPKKLEEVKKRIGEASKSRIMPKGEKAYGWKGGRYTTKRDKYVYVYCPDHPNSVKNSNGGGGYVLEHRLVMERELGRYLTKKEDVHHKNGIKDDNRIENLMLVSHDQHYEEHVCPKCGFKFYTQ